MTIKSKSSTGARGAQPGGMQQALRALNKIQADGVIETYAIGGAVGAAFYIQAQQTEDLDVFVCMKPSETSTLLSLSPVYAALTAQGGVAEGAYIRFGNWPLQILPDTSSLVAEAIREAVPVDYLDVPTRVFSAEHLCAVALQVGREKDRVRVGLFLEQDTVDLDRLREILQRHALLQRLEKVDGHRP